MTLITNTIQQTNVGMRINGILKLLETPKVYFKTPIDAIVLSCAIHRLADVAPGEYYSLDTLTLLEKVIDDDHDFAEKIRKHYSQLLMLENLKGNNLSNFRSDLAKVIGGDGTSIEDKCRGMVIMLPHFYLFDKKLQDLQETTFTSNPSANKIGATLKLIPVCRMYRNVRELSKNRHIYWLKVDTTGVGAKIEIEKKNGLLPFWDKIFSTGAPLDIRGDYKISRDGTLISYQVHNWTLENFTII